MDPELEALFEATDDGAHVPDGIFEQDEPFAQLRDEQQQQQQRQQAPAPNARGPLPAITGVTGRQQTDELSQLVNSFWETNQNKGSDKPQLTPEQELLAQLAQQVAGGNQDSVAQAQKAQQDAQWDAFLAQRNFGPTLDKFVEQFREAGNDAQKNTQVLHAAMQEVGKSVYRDLASDMQQAMLTMVETVVQPMIQKQLEQVNNENSYTTTRATLLKENPHFAAFGAALDPVIKTALARTQGNPGRAVQLAARVIEQMVKNAGGGSNNRGANGGGQAPLNWVAALSGKRA
jgi:hypothetical protein